MIDRAPGLFDIDDRLADLSAKGDDLERVTSLVDFEMFRPALENAVPRADRTKGGRPAFDHVLMFKVLILQAMNVIHQSCTLENPKVLLILSSAHKFNHKLQHSMPCRV